MFYTYAFLREDGSPYYIGKGKGYRINNRKRTVKLPPTERRLLLKKFDNENDAFRHEIYMISLYGRKDIGTGILHNRTAGGEGSVNCVRTQDHLNALHEGRKNIYTPEHSTKISNTLKSKGIKPPSQKGKRWWTNGIESTLSSDCPGDNWELGRLRHWNLNDKK